MKCEPKDRKEGSSLCRRSEAAKERETFANRPKSGRTWKRIQTRRSSASGQVKTKSAWDKQQERKKDKLRVKALQQKLIEERKEKKRLKKMRQQMNKKRKLENELRAVTTQEITRTEKISKMTKKQLKHLRKTSVRADGTVELVPVYGSGSSVTKTRKGKRKR